MAARLSDLLVRDGALPVETVRVAVARQIVYGGALDTALLEMNALAEAALWAELSQASGLPIPAPELVHAPSAAATQGFDAARSERCRAVPVARLANRLQLLCGDPVDREALQEISTELEVDLELFVVPEIRLKMARQMVYGQPIPARFLHLLGRLLGPAAVRRWAEDHAAGPSLSASAVAAGATLRSTALALARDAAAVMDETEALCDQAADPHAAGRMRALHTLRDRMDHPRVRQLAAAFCADAAAAAPERALAAVAGITELRDPLAVPILIELLESKETELAEGARQALIEITKQDFPARRRRWRTWFDSHGDEPRAEWLFAGLAHKVAEIRLASSEELFQLTGDYCGYRFDQPRRERDEARARWRMQWRDRGATRRSTR